MGKIKKVKITSDNLEEYAGIRKFRHGIADKDNLVGITTGLAYTDFGGDLLSIEAVTMNGKGRQQITGQLGDVMKESVQAATSYVRSRAVEFGIPLIRVANTGYSGLISPYGEVLKKLNYNEEGVLSFKLINKIKDTMFKKYRASIFIIIIAIIFILNVLLKFIFSKLEYK